MNWTKEEKKKAVDRYRLASRQCFEARLEEVMDLTAELLAARGGTMMAGELESWLRPLEIQMARPWTADAIRQHIAAQGATLAALEAERDEIRSRVDVLREKASTAEAEMLRYRAELARLREAHTARCRELINIGDMRVHAEREVSRLRHNFARLKPSGQVAEDVAMIRSGLRCTHDELTGPCPHDAALSRLAALAQQGQEAAERTGLPEDTGYLVGEADDAAIDAIMVSRGFKPAANPVDNAPWRCLRGTCGHDDAGKPGHGQEVAALSQAFNEAAKCPHPNPTFIASGECGQCNAERPVQVPYTVTVGPFHPSTEEDWDLSLVEEALTEAPDSAVSNGARYWRRRFLKIVDRLGWVDVQTLKERTDEAHNKGAEDMRAACALAMAEVCEREKLGPGVRIALVNAIDGAAP